jgi:hypothetical protein
MGRIATDLLVMDGVVPRRKLPEVLARILEIRAEHGVVLSNVLHAGDGNLHPNISYDGRDPEARRRVLAAGEAILHACLDAGGSLSGEHGIGIEKRDPKSSFQPGYTGTIMGGDWIYRPTERTMLTLVTDRSVQESTFGDVPYYVSTSASLALHQQVFRKLTANVRLSAGMNDYPSKQTLNQQTKWRKDEFLAYGAGFDYEIQPWVSVGGEYAHTGRWSNFAAFQFQDDRFTGKITFQY